MLESKKTHIYHATIQFNKYNITELDFCIVRYGDFLYLFLKNKV
ncbi:hypothetical protein [Candidatus Electrothrix sp.]